MDYHQINEKDIQVIKDEMQIKGAVNQQIVIKKGGYRPGSGRPRGSKNKLSKEVKAREKGIKERIIKNLDDLLNAQLSLAKGLFFLYEIKMRNVAGKRKPEHILIKDPKRIKAFLDGDLEGEYYYLTAEKPENKAIDSLLDRALGKATTDNQVDSGLSVNIINYNEQIEEPIKRELIENGETRDKEEGNNHPPQLRSETIPDRTPESSSEIQDSSLA